MQIDSLLGFSMLGYIQAARADGNLSTKISEDVLKKSISLQFYIDRQSDLPAFQQLIDQLISFIQSDDIQVGELLPTENMLCQLSGLSRMTVRKAMDDLGKQGYIIAERGRGTFVVSKEPNQGIFLSIGFALRPDRYIEEDPYYSQILLGVTQEAQKQKIHLTFIQGENFANTAEYENHYPHVSGLSGLIIAGQMPKPFLDYVQKIRIPFIFLNYHSSDYACDAVTYDQKKVGELLGRHFFDLGHENVLYLTGEEENIAYEERLAGFRESFMKKKGNSVFVLRGGKDVQTGREMIQAALQQQIPFTAVASANDLIAIGAMNELQDHGYKIPGQISVAGIDNLSMSENCRPSLTSVHIEKQEMGIRALRLLINQIQSKKSIQETILLGVHLVIRQSTRSISIQKNAYSETLEVKG
jgi:LacI family transcriptional regulator